MQRQKRPSVIKKNKDSEEKIMMKSKCSGVLMHLSSLPSEYGIGTMGVEARKFVDFLEAAGQSYWQMLPICHLLTAGLISYLPTMCYSI